MLNANYKFTNNTLYILSRIHIYSAVFFPFIVCFACFEAPFSMWRLRTFNERVYGFSGAPGKNTTFV